MSGASTTPGVSPLPDADARDLRLIAGMIVPADATLGVPGADDGLIFADIQASLGMDRDAVCEALTSARRYAGVGTLAGLDAIALTQRVEAWRRDNRALAMLLVRVVVQCYYRDDRVLHSLGLDPRPPFPLGHTVTEVDSWSLLDDVKARGRIWRDAGGASG